MAWAEMRRIRQRIISDRDDVFNETNPVRTDYYLRYWIHNQEVPWSLLAHLVSRNAGYQMSDLLRLVTLDELGPPGEEEKSLYQQYGFSRSLFCLLEVGNFLILRDVLPPLEAYREGKRHPDHGDELFDMLLEPEFDCDPFAIEEWRRFFNAAKAANWSPQFVSDWSPGSPIERLSFAVIINEQNQIEDRLVNDPETPDHYLGQYALVAGAIADTVSFFATLCGATRLCFPLATSEQDPTASNLMLYKVSDFSDLKKRITVGRELYANLFHDKARFKLLEAWVRGNLRHHGTRVDYNPVGYGTDFLSGQLPGGKDYSPPLVRFQEKDAVWYQHGPKRTLWYSHLQSTPLPLPVSVGVRTEFDPAEFLAPLPVTQIEQLVEVRPVSDQAEIWL